MLSRVERLKHVNPFCEGGTSTDIVGDLTQLILNLFLFTLPLFSPGYKSELCMLSDLRMLTDLIRIT